MATLLLAGVSCSRGSKANAADPEQAIKVQVELAEARPVPEFTEYLATLQSRSSSVLQPEVEGQITRIFVHSGAHVEPGEALIEIDPRKQQATVRSKEADQRSQLAALDYNRQELQRREKLFAAGVVSRQDLEQAQTAYDASRANVESLRASVNQEEVQLRYYTVKAPTAGIIGDIPVRVGDRVATTTVLTTLDRTGELEAYISVPAEKSGAVHLGTPIDILDDTGQPSVRVKTTFVSPRIDPQTQLLLIKAMVPNPQQRFRNDEVVHARVVWKEVQKPLVPVTAITRMSGQPFAYVAVAEGNKIIARQRAVHLGEIIGNDYIVLDGINPGEKVITTGVQMLGDGVPVTPET